MKKKNAIYKEYNSEKKSPEEIQAIKSAFNKIEEAFKPIIKARIDTKHKTLKSLIKATRDILEEEREDRIKQSEVIAKTVQKNATLINTIAENMPGFPEKYLSRTMPCFPLTIDCIRKNKDVMDNLLGFRDIRPLDNCRSPYPRIVTAPDIVGPRSFCTITGENLGNVRGNIVYRFDSPEGTEINLDDIRNWDNNSITLRIPDATPAGVPLDAQGQIIVTLPAYTGLNGDLCQRAASIRAAYDTPRNLLFCVAYLTEPVSYDLPFTIHSRQHTLISSVVPERARPVLFTLFNAGDTNVTVSSYHTIDIDTPPKIEVIGTPYFTDNHERAIDVTVVDDFYSGYTIRAHFAIEQPLNDPIPQGWTDPNA
ncbi:MAG: hypothetical protein OEZ15_05350 [Gammaproteobacteria bacterium]|nr:hypothetical protein [Gammaproteobacteria bacterium]